MSDNPSDYQYVGRQDPGSSPNEFNATHFQIDQRLAQVSTAYPAKVVKVTNTPGQLTKVGTVDVLPLINQVDGNGNSTPHDVVHGICYFRFAGGKNAVVLDPEVDDIGVVVLCDRDISSVKANQDQANPGSRRRHDMADGIYFGVPMSAKDKETPEQYVAFTNNGMTLRDKNDNKIEMESDGIKINGWLFPRDKTANINTHVHTEVMTGSANTGPPP